jgi:hypothetical protein
MGIADRMITAATAVMPPGRRDWGRAIAAELEQASGRADRLRLVLAAARVALVPPRSLGGYGWAVSRSVSFAVIAYLPLGLGLYVTNVVIRSGRDTAAGVFTMDGYLLVTLVMAGALARRASRGPGAPIAAGVAAGVVLAVLGLATFAWLDNAFFSVISQQPDKIDGFRDSGMTSMRAYLNRDLEATAPGVTVILALAGAVFAPIGAAISANAAEAWPRLRRVSR